MPAIVRRDHGTREVFVSPVSQNPLGQIQPFVTFHSVDTQSHLTSTVVAFGLFVSIKHNLEKFSKIPSIDMISSFEKNASHISQSKRRVLGVEVIKALIHRVIGKNIERINSQVILIKPSLLEYFRKSLAILVDYRVSFALQFASDELDKLLRTGCCSGMDVIINLQGSIKVCSQQIVLFFLFNRAVDRRVHLERRTEHLQSLEAEGSHSSVTHHLD
mmetsp:Transcript_984/g.1976  ORF Transcript_984/g.1976 Transcript_984/m.1976 type:complete len:217 (-) Transcript_984:410-1060(-)